MKDGKHFCGIAHTIQTVSNLLTPDTTVANRESTLELKPPLTREGTVPGAAVSIDLPDLDWPDDLPEDQD